MKCAKTSAIKYWGCNLFQKILSAFQSWFHNMETNKTIIIPAFHDNDTLILKCILGTEYLLDKQNGPPFVHHFLSDICSKLVPSDHSGYFWHYCMEFWISEVSGCPKFSDEVVTHPFRFKMLVTRWRGLFLIVTWLVIIITLPCWLNVALVKNPYVETFPNAKLAKFSFIFA